jgi:hypothetical protein
MCGMRCSELQSVIWSRRVLYDRVSSCEQSSRSHICPASDDVIHLANPRCMSCPSLFPYPRSSAYWLLPLPLEILGCPVRKVFDLETSVSAVQSIDGRGAHMGECPRPIRRDVTVQNQDEWNNGYHVCEEQLHYHE